MNSPDIDEILDKLSTKFNKIFYDREFVCCVSQDFQVVLKNKNKCCVVVFPALGPNYLKAVRYQARIFDLAVFALGTGKRRSIAVCQKEFLRKTTEEVDQTHVQIMPEEASDSKLRKKRPERKLYVPPAQRRLSLKEERYDGCRKTSKRKELNLYKPKEDIKKETNCDQLKTEADNSLTELCLDYLLTLNYICILWKYRISQSTQFSNYVYSKYYRYHRLCKKVPLYICEYSSNLLYILQKHCLLWQPKLDIIYQKSDNACANSATYPLFNFKEPFLESANELQRTSTLVQDNFLLRNFDDAGFGAFKVLWNETKCLFSEKDVALDLSTIDCGHKFIISKNGCDYFYECAEDHDIWECYLDKKSIEIQLPNTTNSDNKLVAENGTNLIKASIITLEERFPVEKNSAVQKNNIKNSSAVLNVTSNDLISNEIRKTPKRSSEHEQEKEIMRKTKEHINRKTRPIMKYVDDTGNTLKIGKDDNVNNWEDLFDDDGQLQEELFKEIAHKVGTDVTIVKAKEDYSEYITKQSEDLEHMVELYDFPPSLGTHDIIQAFSEINSDAMYVKWVDDTHAILVLGSLTQAQRAVELDNPLIKARPMAVASGISLATAYKHDLKPAMKRPQTNLQTARRLITTHLGTKSKVSHEQNAKERNDLKAAREMKKMAKKNQQDAWEGNLKSSVN